MRSTALRSSKLDEALSRVRASAAARHCECCRDQDANTHSDANADPDRARDDSAAFPDSDSLPPSAEMAVSVDMDSEFLGSGHLDCDGLHPDKYPDPDPDTVILFDWNGPRRPDLGRGLIPIPPETIVSRIA
jgi:hypothetical protein